MVDLTVVPEAVLDKINNKLEYKILYKKRRNIQIGRVFNDSLFYFIKIS